MPIGMILFGILAPCLFILVSWMVAKSGGLDNTVLRISLLLSGIVFLGGMVIVFPLLPQPRLESVYLRFGLGIPLSVLGIVFRLYPLAYLRQHQTRSDLVSPSKLVTSGPYGVVRHPQYAAGIVFIVGWLLLFGGLYSLYLAPFLITSIFFQALIEEKYILETEFGDAYKEYREQVGMFFPKIRRAHQ